MSDSSRRSWLDARTPPSFDEHYDFTPPRDFNDVGGNRRTVTAYTAATTATSTAPADFQQQQRELAAQEADTVEEAGAREEREAQERLLASGAVQREITSYSYYDFRLPGLRELAAREAETDEEVRARQEREAQERLASESVAAFERNRRREIETATLGRHSSEEGIIKELNDINEEEKRLEEELERLKQKQRSLLQASIERMSSQGTRLRITSSSPATEVAEEKHKEKDEETWNTDGLHDGEEERSKIDVHFHVDAKDNNADAATTTAPKSPREDTDDGTIINHSTAIPTIIGTRMSFVTAEQGNNTRAKPTASSLVNHASSRRCDKKQRTGIDQSSLSSSLSSVSLSSSNHSNENNNTWTVTPLPLLIRIMGYMDNATLMIMCLVCKQINDLIRNGQGMESKLIREFEVRHVSDGRECLVRFLQKMKHCFEDDAKRTMLQGYQLWNIMYPRNIIYKAKNFNNNYFLNGDDEVKMLTQNIEMTGVLSLDASSQSRITVQCYHYFPLLRTIIPLLPNLQRVNLSNLEMSSWIFRDFFSKHCPRLEAIEWNNHNTARNKWDLCHANGSTLRPIANLKELMFDDCCFYFTEFPNYNEYVYGLVSEYEAMSTLNDHPNVFFLKAGIQKKPIERVSIRNASCLDDSKQDKTHKVLLSQNLLIKFVRNAPKTLVWFRSDLSASNIQLLQLEYPDITFVN